jgi:hypothetical protein
MMIAAIGGQVTRGGGERATGVEAAAIVGYLAGVAKGVGP